MTSVLRSSERPVSVASPSARTGVVQPTGICAGRGRGPISPARPGAGQRTGKEKRPGTPTLLLKASGFVPLSRNEPQSPLPGSSNVMSAALVQPTRAQPSPGLPRPQRAPDAEVEREELISHSILA